MATVGRRDDVDPDILARWIGITSLIASASSLATRGAGAWPRLALIGADTAIEAILGLLATEGPTPPPEAAEFDDVYKGAIRFLQERDTDLPQGLRTKIREGHRLRNSALHHGTEPALRAVTRAIETAEALRDFAVAQSPLLEAFSASGPIRAVARLVDISKLSDSLAAAADAQDQREWVAAADNASIALDRALRLVRPRLRTEEEWWRLPLRMRQLSDQTNRELGGAFDSVNKRAEALESWILSIATGLQPREIEGLQRVLGRPAYYAAGPIRINRAPQALGEAEIDRALLLVADVIFRLWLSESIVRPEHEIW